MLLVLSDKSKCNKITPSESIINLLEQINPHKVKFWERADIGQLTIDARDFLWPLKIRDNIIDQIFPNFETALAGLQAHFEYIEIITDVKTYSSSEKIRFNSKFRSNRRDGIVLTILEAKKLYSCLSESQFSDECYCALKIEDEEHFIASFPGGYTMSELSALTEKKLNKPVTEFLPLDPVTGNTIDPDMIIDSSISCINLRMSNARYDYPFPLRKLRASEPLRFKDIHGPENRETPCCNCLSCVSICPSGIAPNMLFHLLLNDETEEIDHYEITACIRCGRCSVVCPSNIPLFSGIKDYLLKKEKEENSEDLDS